VDLDGIDQWLFDGLVCVVPFFEACFEDVVAAAVDADGYAAAPTADHYGVFGHHFDGDCGVGFAEGVEVNGDVVGVVIRLGFDERFDVVEGA